MTPGPMVRCWFWFSSSKRSGRMRSVSAAWIDELPVGKWHTVAFFSDAVPFSLRRWRLISSEAARFPPFSPENISLRSFQQWRQTRRVGPLWGETSLLMNSFLTRRDRAAKNPSGGERLSREKAIFGRAKRFFRTSGSFLFIWVKCPCCDQIKREPLPHDDQSALVIGWLLPACTPRRWK